MLTLMNRRVSVLLVCMGNICRSPTAEGVLRVHLETSGLAEAVEVDSAGTHAYHIGEPPDRRSQSAAKVRGYDLSGLRARKVCGADFIRFDHILAMDRDNLALLRQACPPEHHHKLKLFLEFAENFEEEEVPDPYYGGPAGFDHVLDLVEDAARGLIVALKKQR